MKTAPVNEWMTNSAFASSSVHMNDAQSDLRLADRTKSPQNVSENLSDNESNLSLASPMSANFPDKTRESKESIGLFYSSKKSK